MKVGKDYFEDKKSSFLSIEKDLSLIIRKMMENQDLMKMLYYTQRDCLSAPDLSMAQIQTMLDKQIRIIPELTIQKECPTFVVITFDNFTPNKLNPEFRDCTINFDILCHPDHWHMGNFKLRPHKIAGEIDHMFCGRKLTGIGELQLNHSINLVMNDQLIGQTLQYRAIHGVEDEINPL